MRLNDRDRRLFRIAQSEFPLTERPFRDLGKKAGLSEGETLARLAKLKKLGLLRRIGPVWDAKAMGMRSLLVAFKVPEGRVEKAAAVISRCRGVTHNYLRKADYNLWFTLTEKDPATLNRRIAQLVRKVKPDRFLELPSRKIFKIGVRLEV
jgi:DNA-binding Lrp family transcriptional regulator